MSESQHKQTSQRFQVHLFVTCLADLFRPSIAFNSIALLEEAGCDVTVPMSQTCCGQPGYNTGDYEATVPLAKRLIETFEVADYVVAPSGSCAGMIMLADHILGAITDQESVGGLDITVERNAFGRQSESFETGISITGIREPEREFEGVFIRAPWVNSAGESIEVIAKVNSGVHTGRIVGVRSDTLLATSFHPELTADSRVHELFVEMVRKA